MTSTSSSRTIFGWSEQNARLVEASHATRLGRELRDRVRRRRSDALRRELDPVLAALPEADRRVACGRGRGYDQRRGAP